MEVRALVSFAGRISMHMGQRRIINDEKVLNDLLKAGYVEAVETTSTSKGKKKVVEPDPPEEKGDGKDES